MTSYSVIGQLIYAWWSLSFALFAQIAGGLPTLSDDRNFILSGSGGSLKLEKSIFRSENGRTSRSKRAIISACNSASVGANNFTIDLLLLVDVSVFEFFMEAVGEDQFVATNRMYPYFSAIIAEIDRIYSKQQFSNFSISGVRNAGIVICKNAEHCPWIQNRTTLRKDTQRKRLEVDGLQLLEQLKLWLKEHQDHLPDHDHAMAVTRYDITRFGDSATQGIGYVQSMCNLEESVSAIEDTGAAATVAVAAHELGHSLGAEHDGMHSNKKCPSAHNFLMRSYLSARPKIVANSFKFSECSVRQISKYLSILHKQRHHCLIKSTAPVAEAFGGVDVLPGQHYNADRQCELIYGPTFRFCTDEDYYTSQMCNHLFCRNVRKGPKSPCMTQWYQPSFHGTTCGNKMWCKFGRCVEDADAPSVIGCRFGDRDAGFCERLMRKEPHHCMLPPFNRFCCHTCGKAKKKERRMFLMRKFFKKA